MADQFKPLDVGTDGVNVSLDAVGRLVALNFYHPEHGYATLTGIDPFPEADRYNPQAVRAYRAALATREGFGVQLAPDIEKTEIVWLDDAIPRIRLKLANRGSAEVTTIVHEGVLYQRWTFEGVIPRFGGRVSLQRSAYTQLTEGGPVPMPPVETAIRFDPETLGGLLTIDNPALGGAVAMFGSLQGEPINVQTSGIARVNLALLPGDDALFCCAAGSTVEEAVERARAAFPLTAASFTAALNAERERWQQRWIGVSTDRLLRRGLSYSAQMAIPVGEGICFLTDHMLLPLSWNRDAYYLARALLSWTPDMHDLVRRHLIWMFEQADRPGGAWGRCYLANGQLKDAAFQLDQQLFPLLELAEYTLETDDRATFERLRPHVGEILSHLTTRKATNAALFATAETPADDPIALPYHLSSHILFWVTLRKLERLGIETGGLAGAIYDAVQRHFLADHDGDKLYAYATDGAGKYHLYHDANDFPTVLAPVWGWCSADDPIWRQTMTFAFSEANREGFYNGHLGSVHTRAPWALGDVQALILARILGDTALQGHALDSLRFAAQPDGALPEAYDGETGTVVSRHWFAWSNAAYACVMLDAFKP